MRKKIYLTKSALLVFFSLWSGVANAELLGDRLKPFISTREIYDSNIFRVRNKEQVRSITGDERLSDFVTILTAGVDMNYQIRRQELGLLLKKDFLRYSHYTSQDGDQDEVSGRASLRFLDRFNAKIDGSYIKALEAKENFQTKQKVERMTSAGGIVLGYDMPSGVSLQTAFRQESIDYSLAELRSRERTLQYYSGRLSYAPSSSSTLFSLVYERGIYDYTVLQSFFGLPVNNDNRGDTVKFTVSRSFSPKTSISLSAGYLQRKYKDFKARDFHGIIGNLEASYGISEKVTLTALGARKLLDELFVDQIYSVNDSLGMGITYRPTAKVETYVNGNTTRKSFKGTVMALPLPKRKDKIHEIKTGINWFPIRKLAVDLLYRFSTRTSNFEVYRYRAHGVEIGIVFRF